MLNLKYEFCGNCKIFTYLPEKKEKQGTIKKKSKKLINIFLNQKKQFYSRNDLSNQNILRRLFNYL